MVGLWATRTFATRSPASAPSGTARKARPGWGYVGGDVTPIANWSREPASSGIFPKDLVNACIFGNASIHLIARRSMVESRWQCGPFPRAIPPKTM